MSLMRCLAADLAASLGVDVSRIKVQHKADPAAPPKEEAEGLGLFYLSEVGACDMCIFFRHQDGDETPVDEVRERCDERYDARYVERCDERYVERLSALMTPLMTSLIRLLQVLSPLELLKIVEARLPTGEIHLPSTYHALGSSANGGPVGSSDLEFKIWSKDAPEPKLISVRAVLGTWLGQVPP